MIPVPRIPQVEPNQKLGFGLVNHIIKRTEYAAELLRQYKCVAGDNMFAEPHPDGTRISYLQAVGGGVARPFLPGRFVTPPAGLIRPVNPQLLECDGQSSWSLLEARTGDLSPMSGYVVSSSIWRVSCISTQGASPRSTYSIYIDDAGSFGSAIFQPVPLGPVPLRTGTADVQVSLYNANTFFMWAEWYVYDVYGGVIGINGTGNFKLY